MRASSISSLLLFSFTVVVTGNVAAQTADLATAVGVRSAELAIQAEQPARASWENRIITAIGAGLIGAGAGFFASQVVIGDWDDASSRKRIERPVWAAVGGSLGLVLGFSFPLSGKPGGPVARPQPPPAQQIGPAEFQRVSAKDAYDVVRQLRPQWLIGRGQHVFGETPADAIQVYLDGNHLGGIEALKLISITTIASIQYLDAAAASLRWGAGHSHGAILVIGN
jgi:hypothetical protein